MSSDNTGLMILAAELAYLPECMFTQPDLLFANLHTNLLLINLSFNTFKICCSPQVFHMFAIGDHRYTELLPETGEESRLITFVVKNNREPGLFTAICR